MQDCRAIEKRSQKAIEKKLNNESNKKYIGWRRK